MARGRHKKTQPGSFDELEQALWEEVSVSEKFGLPLTLILAVMDTGWEPEAASRAMGVVRGSDLVAQAGPSEIAIVLPNTGRENALLVEKRLLSVVPEARTGVTIHEPNDTPRNLLDRARGAASESL